MKKISIILILLMTITTFAQDTKAKILLDKVSKQIKSYDSLYIEFSNSLDNNNEGVHQTTTGSASIKGDLYQVNLLGTTTVFDGKKVHTIIPEDEEVNISDPDEDIFTPAQFFSFYESGYNYEMATTETVKGKKLQFVKLLPIDSNSDFTYVLLGIDTKSNSIYKIIQKGKNGTDITLLITSFKANINLEDSIFKFNKTKFEEKGYLINEL